MNKYRIIRCLITSAFDKEERYTVLILKENGLIEDLNIENESIKTTKHLAKFIEELQEMRIIDEKTMNALLIQVVYEIDHPNTKHGWVTE